MSKEQTFESTKFITGLRAYSALGVFLVHVVAGTGALDNLPFLKQVCEFGRFGVISFFVISAFTICMSVDNAKEFSFKQYILRRFLRIAPMYYVVLLICFCFTDGISNQFEVKMDFYNLFMHLTFLNLFDARHANNILAVEATVPIEFAYYLVIPFAFQYFKGEKSQWLMYPLLVFTFLISVYSLKLFMNFYNPIAPNISNHWSVEKYLFTFTIGVFTYIIWKVKLQIFPTKSFILLAHFFLLAYIIRQDFEKTEMIFSIWVVLLIFICASKSWLSQFLFENKIIDYIGKISYSIYLIHVPIIILLREYIQNTGLVGLVAITITLFLSSLSYKFIEKPFIKLSKKL